MCTTFLLETVHFKYHFQQLFLGFFISAFSAKDFGSCQKTFHCKQTFCILISITAAFDYQDTGAPHLTQRLQVLQLPQARPGPRMLQASSKLQRLAFSSVWKQCAMPGWEYLTHTAPHCQIGTAKSLCPQEHIGLDTLLLVEELQKHSSSVSILVFRSYFHVCNRRGIPLLRRIIHCKHLGFHGSPFGKWAHSIKLIGIHFATAASFSFAAAGRLSSRCHRQRSLGE